MPLINMVKQYSNVKGLALWALRSIRDIRFYAPVLLLSLFLLTSCSSDDSTEASRTVMVQFTIYIGNSSASNAAKHNNAKRTNYAPTRAEGDTAWTQYTPNVEGEGIENVIDVAHLHVLLYTVYDNGNLSQVAGEVKNLSLLPTKEANVYNVLGDMSIPTDRLVDNSTFNGRLVVFANTDNNVGWEPSNLDNVTYGYMPNRSVGNPSNLNLQSIPMWGMGAVKKIILKGGEYNDLGTVDLLRSMAKVRVHLTKEMRDRGFSFDRISIDRYNTSGCVMPSLTEINKLTSEQGTRNLTYAHSFHLPTSVSAETTPLSFLEAEGDTVSQTLYIPEYDNSSNPASITVTLRGGSGVSTFSRTASFPFAAYNASGDRTGNMDIVRNHDYEFYVYSNALRLHVYVVDWTVIDHGDIQL